VTRNETISEILKVVIDALGKEVDPGNLALVEAVRRACIAGRYGDHERYRDLLEYVRNELHIEERP
jgi:hypothetical protein